MSIEQDALIVKLARQLSEQSHRLYEYLGGDLGRKNDACEESTLVPVDSPRSPIQLSANHVDGASMPLETSLDLEQKSELRVSGDRS